MLILGLDTATSSITVAVHDGLAVLSQRHRVDPRGHCEHLSPLIDAALTAADAAPGDLTDVAVGTGPGPFTGLRVGLVTALTLGHALGVPVHGVCSLDALANAAAAEVEGDLLVATDARRKEVYWARYAAHDGRAEALDEPAVNRPADLPEAVRQLPSAGRAPMLYPDLFTGATGPLDVDGGVLAALAARRIVAGEPMPAEPRYLRRPDALTSAERAAR